MQAAALLWHLRILSDQPVVVSGIGLVQFLPVLIFAPFGGVIADSFNRRKIMFAAQFTMTLTALLLGILTLLGHIQIWQIYILTAIQSIATSFDLPARQALVSNLVPQKILPNAFSLQSIAFNTGSILGPALSGMVIGYLGQSYVYLINTLTFIAVLGALILMGPVVQETTAPLHGIRNSFSSIKEGIQYILHQPIILSSMILDFIATFFSSANTLLPFVARDILKVGEIQYGWLAAGQSVGGVLVGFFYSQKNNVRNQGRVLLISVTGFGLATVFFGFSTSFALSMIALILIGGFDGVSTILRNTLRQIQTPDQLRGRMVSINQIFFMGGPQLGEIEAGMAAQAWGTPLAIITGGIGCMIGVALVAKRWPQLRRYDTADLESQTI